MVQSESPAVSSAVRRVKDEDPESPDDVASFRYAPYPIQRNVRRQQMKQQQQQQLPLQKHPADFSQLDQQFVPVQVKDVYAYHQAGYASVGQAANHFWSQVNGVPAPSSPVIGQPQVGSSARSLTPGSDQRLSQVVSDVFRSFEIDQARLEIPRDPLLWSNRHVHCWLNWAVETFAFDGLDRSKFTCSGQELVRQGKGHLLKLAPSFVGDILWEHLELLMRG